MKNKELLNTFIETDQHFNAGYPKFDSKLWSKPD